MRRCSIATNGRSHGQRRSKRSQAWRSTGGGALRTLRGRIVGWQALIDVTSVGRNYVFIRDLLRRSSDARDQYEAVKLRLVEEFGDDRKAYTDGKSDIVRLLIREPE